MKRSLSEQPEQAKKLQEINKKLREENRLLKLRNAELIAKNGMEDSTPASLSDLESRPMEMPRLTTITDNEFPNQESQFEKARETTRQQIGKLTDIIKEKTIELRKIEKKAAKTGKQLQNLIQKRDKETGLIRDDENKIARLTKQYDLTDRKKPASSIVVRWFLNVFTKEKDSCYLASNIAGLSEKIKIRRKIQVDVEKQIKISLREDSQIKHTLNELKYQYDSLQELRRAFQQRQSKIIDLMTESKLSADQQEIIHNSSASSSENRPLLPECGDQEFQKLVESCFEQINTQTNKDLM